MLESDGTFCPICPSEGVGEVPSTVSLSESASSCKVAEAASCAFGFPGSSESAVAEEVDGVSMYVLVAMDVDLAGSLRVSPWLSLVLRLQHAKQAMSIAIVAMQTIQISFFFLVVMDALLT